MPAAPRAITGNAAILTGEARAGIRVTFTRKGAGDVFAQYGEVIVNEPVTITSSEGGELAGTLLPGEYDVVALGSNGQKRFVYALTEDGSTDIADGIGQAAPVLSSSADIARDKAREWATNPEDDPVEPGEFSARHWAAKAEGYANSYDAQALADAVAATEADALATSQDRVQTGLDRVQTGLDTVATAADRVLAQTARGAAESARDTAFTNANVYADTTAGLAAVSVGQQFQVVSGDESIRYREDAGPVATEIVRFPTSVNPAPSLFDGNDFRVGSSGWNVSSFSTQSYGADGLTLTRSFAGGGTSWTGRIFKDVPGVGLALTAGRRYAMYVDVTLENNVGSIDAATVLWTPFILSATPVVSYSDKRLAIGANGSPIRHREAISFIEASTGTKNNPYTDLSLVRSAGGTNLAAFDIKIIYHAYMVVDLGAEGEPLFDLTDEEVANLLTDWGAPYHPTPGATVSRARIAARAVSSRFADQAASAEQSDLATLAEALRSPYEGKRFISLGHSLVSQVNWQPALIELLSCEGYSFQGTAGGTLAPKPAESVKGMFSRAAMTAMLSSIINVKDAGAGGINTTGLTTAVKNRTAATIFWTGANDGLMDLSSQLYGTLAANREKLETLEARAIALSSGHFVSTAAGLSGTTTNQYFTTNGAVSGFRVLYRHINTGSPVARAVYHYPHAGQSFDADRIMTTAEQDEFEARNTSQGANAFLSEPLSNGFIPTYEALYHTMIANYLAATGFDQVPEHRFFIVREPQAFWRYDGTLDWPQGYWEKNEVHRRVADRWGIPLVDLWAESGINISTRGWFIQNEDNGNLFIHINDKGGRQVANVFRARMLQHPPLNFISDTDGSFIALPTIAGDLGPWRADNVVSP